MTYTELQKSINQIIEEISRQMYNNNYTGVYLEDIYIDMKKYMYGYIDKKFPSSMDTELNNKLKSNIDRFLAGKNYQQFLETKDLMFDSTMTKIPYSQFLDNVKSVNKKFNQTWFKTESDFIGNSINVAKKMETYGKLDTKKYGLKFIATNDELTRDSHRVLNGIIKPMNDSFWINHLPPLDYNCRCSVQAVMLSNLDPNYVIKSDQQISKSKSFGESIPEGLETNVYANGKFFTDQHPYIKNTNKTNDIESVVKKLNKK